MIINLITLATVKTYLGLSATTYDAALTAMIPIVSADVRRILNNQYDDYLVASFDETATDMEVSASTVYGVKTPRLPLPIGTVVYNTNLPDDTYIAGYDSVLQVYTLSATPDDAGTSIYSHINISMWSTISKMIWYRTQKLSTDMPTGKVDSKTMGPLSITYAKDEVNAKWDYPQALIDDLGTPYQRVG